MSRNYQLLEKMAKEEFFTPAGRLAPSRIPLPSAAARKGIANEETTKLVQRLFLKNGEQDVPSIVSFSGMAREDRSSWICARAAESLAAQAGASVCVVDANFRSPQLHTLFDISNKLGLGAALKEDGAIGKFATPVAGKNLWLIPAGSARQGLDATPDRLRTRFADLRKEYDYVFVSAPALTHETEAILMGQLGDGIVLIIEANQTGRKTVRIAKDHLEAAKVKLLGAVLDQRKYPIPEFLYKKL
jgi:Mrp family chromosome partitioning ATPase